MVKQHPRFLGFLWKHHRFERKEDLLCTEECVYLGCDKERHKPRNEEIETFERSRFNVGVLIFELRCKVCGKVDRYFSGPPHL